MRSHRIVTLAWALASLIAAGSALAQTAPAQTSPPQNVQPPPEVDEAFLTGLRRVGVMAGQVVECSPDAEKQAQIGEAMELAEKIAMHFGLKAAFNYVGAVGYGSGHPFDKAACNQSVEGWKEIQAKYLKK